MRSPLKHIFFDLDGTLVQSIPVLYDVYHKFLAEFGITGSRSEFDTLNGPALDEIILILRTRYQLRRPAEELLQMYQADIQSAYDERVQPMPGAHTLLEAAFQKHCSLTLVTSNQRTTVEGFLQRNHWVPYFQQTVYGDDVLAAKPDPEIYRIALRKNNISNTHAIVVEDSYNGVLSAKSNSLFVIGLAQTQSSETLRRAGADQVVATLHEVQQLLSLAEV